jgi:hypothetical protein
MFLIPNYTTWKKKTNFVKNSYDIRLQIYKEFIPSAIGRQSKILQFIPLKPKIYSGPRPITTHFVPLAKIPANIQAEGTPSLL